MMSRILLHHAAFFIVCIVGWALCAHSQARSVATSSAVPSEVKYPLGYVNSVSRPPDFGSAMLWGIAVADTRVPGYESAVVEIASTQLSCLVDGKTVILNDDAGNVRGGLYQRHPWFATDNHEPISLRYSGNIVLLDVGQRSDRIWHFWSASPRATLPDGKLAGCTVRVRAKISPGALLQIGMDYWRSATISYGPGGNNHEAGASKWYFPSPQWQDAVFTDVITPQF